MMTWKTRRCCQHCPTDNPNHEHDHGLIFVTIASTIIGIDTRIDVVAVICRYIKVGMAARLLFFFYTLLGVAEDRE